MKSSPGSAPTLAVLIFTALLMGPGLGHGAAGDREVEGYHIGTIGGMGPLPEQPPPLSAPELGYRRALPQTIFYNYIQRELSPPVRLGDRLLVGTTRDPGVHVFEAGTGVLLEVWPTSGAIESPLLAEGGAVYAADVEGQLTAFEAESGAVIWQIALGESMTSPLHLGEGRLYYQTLGGDLGALDAETGESIWVYGREKPTTTPILGSAGVIPMGELVFAGFADGTAMALTADRGEVLWEAPIAAPSSRWMDVDTVALTEGDCLIVSTYEGPTLCVRPQSGAIVWSQKAPIFGAPLVIDGTLYGATSEGRILALDLASGQQIWEWTAPKATVDRVGRLRTQAPVLWEGHLAVATTRGWIHGLAPKTGDEVWTYRPWIEAFGFYHSPTVEEGALYLTSGGGSLYQLRAQSYQPAELGSLRSDWLVMPETAGEPTPDAPLRWRNGGPPPREDVANPMAR